jgi:hypothetical protein
MNATGVCFKTFQPAEYSTSLSQEAARTKEVKNDLNQNRSLG